MQQLIIAGIYLPETSHDKYQCWPEELGQQIDMISGRRVYELRGHVQKIAYSYDYLTADMWQALSGVLRAGNSFTVTYLPDNSEEMKTGIFLCESLTQPTFAFSRYGKAFWHNISFTLREVSPHD